MSLTSRAFTRPHTCGAAYSTVNNLGIHRPTSYHVHTMSTRSIPYKVNIWIQLFDTKTSLWYYVGGGVVVAVANKHFPRNCTIAIIVCIEVVCQFIYTVIPLPSHDLSHIAFNSFQRMAATQFLGGNLAS
jgi:hypothetical protein